MAIRSCSICGTPRPTGPQSRANMVCHDCIRNGHSRRMSAEERRRKSDAYRAEPVTRTCRRCPSWFTVPRRSHRKYCDWCYGLGLYRSPRTNTAPTRPRSHRDRARHYGVEYEPIKAHDIFVRDGWRCGICGHDVDQHLRYPDQMRASLDHIVAMSRGGGHVHTNVQCSHLRCNIRKQAGEQPTLIGTITR